jgi:RNA polymerase sigma factor (sigma-70 family)
MLAAVSAELHGLLQEVLPRAYVAAFRILGDRDEARDACHEAARRALAAERSYDPARPFYPWFHRIVKNCCLDRLSARRAARVREVAMTEEPSADAPGAEAALMGDQRAQAVSRAVLALPEELRAVIELRHYEDASYAEMAELLGVPEGTVMSRLYRARQRLRAALSDDPAFSRPEAPAGGAR